MMKISRNKFFWFQVDIVLIGQFVPSFLFSSFSVFTVGGGSDHSQGHISGTSTWQALTIKKIHLWQNHDHDDEAG